MKKSNEMSLGEAIQHFLKRTGLDEKVLETEIYGRWEELAGWAINLKTRKLVLDKGVLHVFLTSSVLRNELSLRKSEMLKQINERLGSTAHLADIKFR